MALNFELTQIATPGSKYDERWRRTRGDNRENVAGTITVADFSAVVDENGFIPSGVAVTLDATSGNYKPLEVVDGASTDTLDGFISDVGGVDVNGVTTSGVSISIRETIVPKYLPVETHRELSVENETSGVFVYIKE